MKIQCTVNLNQIGRVSSKKGRKGKTTTTTEKEYRALSKYKVQRSRLLTCHVLAETAKMKLLPSVFTSLKSRVKIFVFVANSRRHFSIFM